MFSKVSILVPVYGVADRIERCARSLFEQTYGNIEYVFVNDCTPDDSIRILKSVVEEYPNRLSAVKIIEHEINMGLASARNTAVDNAIGDFVLHVDSDDYLSVNAVEELINQQCLDDSDIVNSGYVVYHESYSENWDIPDFDSTKSFTISLLSREIPVCVAGRLIRRSLYVENNIRAIDGVNMAEDYAISPLLAFFATRISTVHSYLYHYDCTNEISYTHTFSVTKCEQMWRALDNHYNFFLKRGREYGKALEYAKLSILILQLKLCALDGHQSCYYHELLNRCSRDDDRSCINRFPIYDRILLNINNYVILKWYVRVAFIIRGILKRFSRIK